MNDAAKPLPFHATESERRIIRELTGIAALRQDGDAPLADPGHWKSHGIDSAAKCIAYLKENLFPEEAGLMAVRGNLLKPLQADYLRTHFDQTLETATLTLNAKIRNAGEYRSFLEKLNAFDFEAWARHCDTERSDAD